jgi:hypothetical protein
MRFLLSAKTKKYLMLQVKQMLFGDELWSRKCAATEDVSQLIGEGLRIVVNSTGLPK